MKIGAWVVLSLVLLAALTTKGFWFHKRDVRDMIDDEGTRANRVAALGWGFVAGDPERDRAVLHVDVRADRRARGDPHHRVVRHRGGARPLRHARTARDARCLSALANRLKDRRGELGLTQAALAEAVGVTRKTVNTVENGVFVPSALLALKLARALDEPVERSVLAQRGVSALDRAQDVALRGD